MARHDFATLVCVIYGFVPVLLMLVPILGAERGFLPLRFLLALVCGGPVLGLLIGGTIDRAHEAYHKGAWGSALCSAFLSVGIAAGVLAAVATVPVRDDETDLAFWAQPMVARQVEKAIVESWKQNPETHGATIRKLTLRLIPGPGYAGEVEATIAGKAERLSLEVTYPNGKRTVTLKPIKEQ